jgi:hypothetical protein
MHGMCRPSGDPRAEIANAATIVNRALTGSTPPAVVEREPHERLTDADREQATELLSAAFRDGIIRVEELDERLTAALNAQTAGELRQVTSDLPAQWLAEREAAAAAERRAAKHRRRWSAEVRTYARVMALLVTIWLVTSLLTAEVRYPWPIWPALGWGIPLFLSRPRGPAARAVRRLRAARGL